MKSIRDNGKLNTVAQSGMTAIGRLLSFALLTALLAAWVVSEPFLAVFDDISGRTKEKVAGQKLRKRTALLSIIWTATVISSRTVHAQSETLSTNFASDATITLKSSNTNIWQDGLGEGFRSGVQSISLEAGAGPGLHIFGSEQYHDLALASLSYGYMWGSVKGDGHWYKGNWELRGEFFAGAQFSPTSDWLVGLTPHLRYNFATGTRWVPFADLGAGVSATSIGPPDLSHYFEFNLQAGTGVYWFIKDDLALSIQARYMHMSCAGINKPNQGLNNVNFMLGASWFF